MTWRMKRQQRGLVIDLDDISILDGLEPCLRIVTVRAGELENTRGSRRDRSVDID